jgi:DNA-binding response OmpR family regulator
MRRVSGAATIRMTGDADFRETLADYLAGEHGFTLSLAETLDEADIAFAKNGCIDAVILDVDLPDGDGRDYCAKLRRLGHAMPVIMLTGQNTAVDTVCGLNSGANDYVAKPFRLNELLARLRAQWDRRLIGPLAGRRFACAP